jgi:hypothetical protein
LKVLPAPVDDQDAGLLVAADDAHREALSDRTSRVASGVAV